MTNHPGTWWQRENYPPKLKIEPPYFNPQPDSILTELQQSTQKYQIEYDKCIIVNYVFYVKFWNIQRRVTIWFSGNPKTYAYLFRWQIWFTQPALRKIQSWCFPTGYFLYFPQLSWAISVPPLYSVLEIMLCIHEFIYFENGRISIFNINICQID